MKNKILLRLRIFFMFVFLCAMFFASAQTDTIKIDLGPAGSIQESVSPWNNLTIDAATSAVSDISDCLNSQGNLTGISVTMTDPFWSVNYNGSTSPQDSLYLVSTATMDNLYCDDNSGPAKLTISGLDPTKVYNFGFFACRDGVSDNREAKYVVTGSDNGTASLNSSNNSSDMAHVNGITPYSDGTVTIDISNFELFTIS